VAAVFTTEAVEQPLAAILAAITAAPAPALSPLVHCGDPGAVSPCDDGLTGANHVRGCLPGQPGAANFDEYQGTVSLLTLPEYSMVTITPPISANQSFGSLAPITAAQAQYQPDGTYDGHFVSTNNPSARQDIQTMLVTFVREPNPIIEP
jgi:hypothetical protein